MFHSMFDPLPESIADWECGCCGHCHPCNQSPCGGCACKCPVCDGPVEVCPCTDDELDNEARDARAEADRLRGADDSVYLQPLTGECRSSGIVGSSEPIGGALRAYAKPGANP